MLSPVATATELVTGERMTVEEFLRRWEELPDLKNAELNDGFVHVPSPVTSEHGPLFSDPRVARAECAGHARMPSRE
jgi:hypothetical protein